MHTHAGPVPGRIDAIGSRAMASEARLIVELVRDSEVDRNLRADPPPSLQSGRVVLDHFPGDEDGRLGPPEAGEIVMTVPSPETLRRDQPEVQEAVLGAEDEDQPPVILVEAAEYLREDELAPVLEAADLAQRVVILRILSDA
jgi:hypothetical protein